MLDLFVSPCRDDGAPGATPDSPFLTVNRASPALGAGDIVRWREGIYRDPITWHKPDLTARDCGLASRARAGARRR